MEAKRWSVHFAYRACFLIYMTLLWDGVFFIPSWQTRAIIQGSNNLPMAKPGSKSSQFASKISVLHNYIIPTCPSKLGIETGLTPNFTSLLIASRKDTKSDPGKGHSFIHSKVLGDYKMPGTGFGQWGHRGEGQKSYHPFHVVIRGMSTVTILPPALETVRAWHMLGT